MDFNLDPLILVVPVLISARTASHCVQLMERYYDEIRVGAEQEAAVRVSMGELLLPATLGILADAFALLVLTVAAAEAAIGLAVLVVYFRNRGSIAVEDVNLMKG